MDAAQIEALRAALAAEQAARATADAALAARIDGSTDARIDRLVAVIEQLVPHVGLLVQAVAQLLGEEAGTPVQDEGAEPERVDLDGNPY